MSQIYNASYLKGGVEFGTELVTAGIIGKAKKALGGGMSEQAVREFTKDSWKKVLGDTFSEGISEGLADTGSRIVDSVVFGDDFDGRDATIGFLDSAIVGAIVGGKVSTFGQIGAREKILNETEGSLLDQVTLQQLDESIENEVAEVKERTEKHVKALKDMTKPELIEYAKNLDNQRKVRQEIDKIEKADEAAAENNPNYEYTDTTVLEEQAQKAEEQAYTVYNTVYNWEQTHLRLTILLRTMKLS